MSVIVANNSLVEDIQDTSLNRIFAYFSDKALEANELFHDLVLLDLSFERFYPRMNFYGKKGHETCYFTLQDKHGRKVSIQCPKDVYLKSHNKYNFDASKSVDVRIDSLSCSKDGRITILIKSIRENGISEAEIIKRNLRKYCEDRGYFSIRNMKLPSFVSNIALLTTNTGNTASDILQQTGLQESTMFLYTCGSNSNEIANKLSEIVYSNRHQIVVLFRGGNEDKYMLEFSKQPVLDVIVNSPILVASAIGHESDKPIVQSVVDIGFDTPSSFAQEIKMHNERFVKNFYLVKRDIDQSCLFLEKKLMQLVLEKKRFIVNSVQQILKRSKEKVAQLKINIFNNISIVEVSRRDKKKSRIIFILIIFILMIIGIFLFVNMV